VWEANSSEVHAHVMAMTQPTSAYWETIQHAAMVISLFLRWRCVGNFFGGRYLGEKNDSEAFANRPRINQTRNGETYPVYFQGFDSAKYHQQTGTPRVLHSRDHNHAGIWSHGKEISSLKLKRLHELGKLRRLLDTRQAAASRAVRDAWQIEFHKHIGKPGQAADHSMCPSSACCRDAALAKMYKWYPVPSETLLPATMEIVKECMNLPSTIALLDELASAMLKVSTHSDAILRRNIRTLNVGACEIQWRNFTTTRNRNRPATYTYKSKQRRQGKTCEKKHLEPPTWEWQKRVIEKVMSY
jgi:hypothetical protein